MDLRKYLKTFQVNFVIGLVGAIQFRIKKDFLITVYVPFFLSLFLWIMAEWVYLTLCFDRKNNH